MDEFGLEELPYCLDFECPVPWPPSQEAALCQEYPLKTAQEESLDEFVMRRYLETLWLPESIMPLHHFVQSLRRVLPSASHPHPLQAALGPLLLSIRLTQEKYHVELPQILQDEGGTGDLEETYMWFAWSKEKFQPDAIPEEGSSKNAEERWKTSWMQRLERREVQIQILMYMQLLASTAPSLTTHEESLGNPGRRKDKHAHGPLTPEKALPPTSTTEPKVVRVPPTSAKSTTTSAAADIGDDLTLNDRLEYFMDRLSLWQLVESLESSRSSKPSVSRFRTQPERDWMQTFCEDVVEPLFKELLPEQCALLRTKVFPCSPFTDDSHDAASPPSPNISLVTKGKSKRKRAASPLRLTELQPHPTRPESQENGAYPDRHRSRSRSVSISVEEVRSRGARRGGVASSKTLFKDEVSMKRTASRTTQPKPLRDNENLQGRTFSRNNSFTNASVGTKTRDSKLHSSPQTREPRLLVADTPVKKIVKAEEADPLLLASRPHGNEQLYDGETEGLPHGTFALDTPVKKRPKR